MRLPPFAYHAPKGLESALKIKGELGAQALVLAGGTDLLVNLKHRLLAPAGPAPVVLKDAENLIKGNAPHPDVVAKVRDIAVRAAEGVIVEDSSVSKKLPYKDGGSDGFPCYEGISGTVSFLKR